MKRAVTYIGLALLVVAGPALAGQDREVWSPAELPGNDAPTALVPSPWDGPATPLYDNGPLVTHPGGGAGGADASALQTALGMTIFGYGHQLSAGNRVADDFTVPAGSGWLVTDVTFFAYQTGSTTTSTIDHVNYRIWDGVPGGGGSVIFGDTTTNVLTNTTWSNAYRVLDTSLLDSNRPIMANTVSAGILLPPGTYWLDWQTGGTLASGPWAPPVSVLGSTGTGNALQSVDGGVTYAAIIDVGPQDFPFQIFGLEGNCNAPALAIPDNDPTGATDTITIPAPPLNDIITDLDVVIQASHTWVGDLTFTLQHVDTATSVVPFDQPTGGTGSCSSNDIDVNINDEGVDGAVSTTCLAGPPAVAGDLVGGEPPDTTLFTAFDGEPIAGDWTLTAVDHVGADSGTLDAWCIVATTDTMPFIDGFESGDTSAWTVFVP